MCRVGRAQRAPPFFGRLLVVGLAALDPPYLRYPPATGAMITSSSPSRNGRGR